MITPDQAYSEIKKLVADGKLYKYCGGKYTKYKVIPESVKLSYFLRELLSIDIVHYFTTNLNT